MHIYIARSARLLCNSVVETHAHARADLDRSSLHSIHPQAFTRLAEAFCAAPAAATTTTDGRTPPRRCSSSSSDDDEEEEDEADGGAAMALACCPPPRLEEVGDVVAGFVYIIYIYRCPSRCASLVYGIVYQSDSTPRPPHQNPTPHPHPHRANQTCTRTPFI